MKSKKGIIIGAWVAFVSSLIVYLLTIEPTASLWDCSEFIACAYRLEIAHPPGAPLFILMGRIFTLFAGGDVTKVAMMVNIMSATASAFTIFFLYLTIAWFIKKLVSDSNPLKIQLIIAGAFIGAMAYTFTDSFWFSAVEGEVYGTSSMFTAMVFWAILRWEEEFERSDAFRWIMLIFFLLGLSIGVHLLNLLAIPAIAMVVYYRAIKPGTKNFLYTIAIAALILMFMVFMYIPGLVKVGAYIDLFTVNTLGMPINWGFLIYLMLFFGALLYGIYYTRKNKRKIAHLTLLGLAMLTLGYSTYSTIVVRSLANPSIDMSNPDNPFSLLYYLNREQYGSRPLLYGPYYNAPVVNSEERSAYVPFQDKYIPDPLNPDLDYDKRFETIFPRMASTDQSHFDAYKQWGGDDAVPVKVTRNGKTQTIMKPTFGDNLRFFFRYQIGHMYLRYFFWNFIGRQNDMQGFGGRMQGNWISGIPFIDQIRLGPQDNLPDKLKNNKARNTYYFLPFILGLIGLFYQYKKHRNGFWTAFLLFFFTGLAIVIYLNEVPVTPRERDYVYVGSFYAFAIWIGLSIPAIVDGLKKYMPGGVSLAIASIVGLLAGPVILGTQNWNDHDRSNRYIARDLGYDYLNSCRKDAILFTTADNDTYPLWFGQEVEGFRRDVRQVLQPYLSANWYINQQRRDKPENAGLPLSLPESAFTEGKREYVPVIDRVKEVVNLKDIMDFVASDNDKTRIPRQDRTMIDYIPAKQFSVPVDTIAAYKDLPVPEEMKGKKKPLSIQGTFKKSYLLKSDLIIMDVIAQNNWKRPIYFLNPQTADQMGLGDYLLPEGLGYRLVPYKVPNGFTAYKYNDSLFMNAFRWGNIQDPKVYAGWTIRRTVGLVLRVRDDYNQIASSYISKGDSTKARQVLDRSFELFPNEQLPYGLYAMQTIRLYMQLGDKDMAMKIFSQMRNDQEQMLDYTAQFPQEEIRNMQNDVSLSLYMYRELTNIATQYKFDVASQMQQKMQDLMMKYNIRG